MTESIEVKKNKKRIKKLRNLKIFYLFVCFLGGDRKTKWLRKNKIFGLMGDNVIFQPRTLPNEPGLLKMHNNVKVAAGVTFYTHDIINMVFARLDDCDYRPHRSCIEIYDNCFIGGNSTIVGDVSIGPNSIVAAGSVVTKDVLPGQVVGGVPARVIGTFDDIHNRRLSERVDNSKARTEDEIWEDYYRKHRNDAF